MLFLNSKIMMEEKMGLKAKLLSCVAMFVFIVGVVVVGVLAASNADFLFQGDLNYNIADKSLYVKDVQYQHGMIGEPVTVPGFREGYINNGFELNIESAQIETNTVGNFVLYFDIINLIVDNQTHEYIASASWADTAVTGISFSIDTSSATIAKGTVTPENLTDSTPISGRVALEIRSTVDQSFDLSNIAVLFSQIVNISEVNYTFDDGGGITIESYSGSGANLIIPDSYIIDGVTYPVTSIGDDAFTNDNNIQAVTLPDTITRIGSHAFSDCQNLSVINMQEGLIEIGSYAFTRCLSLTSVDIPSSVTSIGSYTFQYCYSLTSINLPENLTAINSYLFQACSSVTTITISKNVNTISIGAFSACTSLSSIYVDPDNTKFKSIDGVLFTIDGSTLIQYPAGKTDITTYTVPDTVSTIGDYAFSYISSLQNVIMSNTVANTRSSGLQNVILPISVESIGQSAFSNCNSLESISIPANINEIGEGAFAACASLVAIDVDPDNTNYKSQDGALFTYNMSTLIQYPAGKSDVVNYSIPTTVTTLGQFAFSMNRCLQSIDIPDSVTTIGSYAFQGCSSLTNISIPEGVTYLPYAVFAACTSLESIFLPEGLLSIDFYAFSYCNSLTSITIPSTVNIINDTAFKDCTLTTVIVNSPTIAAMLSSEISAGYLIDNATTVYVSENAAASLPMEFASLFTETSTDKTGYKKYTSA